MLRSTSKAAPAIAFVGLALLAAAMLGLLAGAAPVTMTIAVCGTGLVMLAVLQFRRALRGVPTKTESLVPGARSSSAERDLRAPRILFYLGALTVTEVSFRPMFDLTISVIFFLAAFAGCASAVLRGYGVAPVPVSLVAGVLIFVVGGAISSAGAHSPADSGASVLRAVFVLLLWAWTAAMVLNSRQQILIVMALWAVSAAANGAAGVGDVLGLHEGSGDGLRALGFTDHPNDLGGGAAVALIPTLMLATRPRARRASLNQIGRWILVALVAAAIVLSASVAAMLAGLAAMVIWLSSPSVRAPGRVAVSMALGAAVLATVVAAGNVPSPTERIEQVTSPSSLARPDAGSGEARLEEMKAAWARIAENPLVGTGFDPAGTGVTILYRGQPAITQMHGAPIAAWYEGGIFALVGLMVTIAALAAAGWRGLAAANGEDELVVGWALFAAFSAWIVYSLSNALYFQEWGWISGAMLVAWAVNCAGVPQALSRRAASSVGAEVPST